MKPAKLIFTIITCLLVVSLAAAPEISFNFLTHDFGDIKEEDGKVTYDFDFTNTGDEPLKLIKVKAS